MRLKWNLNKKAAFFHRGFAVEIIKWIFRIVPCYYLVLNMAKAHWGRVTHICVGKLTIICSDNGLSPGRRQAIVWTNAGILFIRSVGTNFSEILGKFHSFSFKKMHLKMSSQKGRLFSLGLNELNQVVHIYIIIEVPNTFFMIKMYFLVSSARRILSDLKVSSYFCKHSVAKLGDETAVRAIPGYISQSYWFAKQNGTITSVQKAETWGMDK